MQAPATCLHHGFLCLRSTYCEGILGDSVMAPLWNRFGRFSMAICLGNHDSGVHMPPRVVFERCFLAWPRPIFFSCSVYCGGTGGASQGHADGRFWGDFVRGGGFRVAYAAPGRVWMVFPCLASTYIFSVQCILWSCMWGITGAYGQVIWGDFVCEGGFVPRILPRVTF